MNKTEYTCLLPVNHDGEQHEIGDPIFLTDKQAAPLFAVGAIDGAPESLLAGTPSGESTAAADALVEQTDKDTNQDPAPVVAEVTTEPAPAQPAPADPVPADPAPGKKTRKATLA